MTKPSDFMIGSPVDDDDESDSGGGEQYGSGGGGGGGILNYTPGDWALIYRNQTRGKEIAAEIAAKVASAEEDSQGWDDLTEGWDDPAPVPVVMARSDGKCLGYMGIAHVIGGVSEGGKTRLADMATVQEVNAGRPVIRYDLENGGMLTRQVLRDMGMTKDQMKEFVRYRYATAPWSVEKAEREAEAFREQGGRMVVLDSSTEIAAALQLEVSGGRSESVADLYRLVMRPWKEAGCSVWIIDNVNKSDALDLAGSQHKKAGLDAGIGVVPGKPFGVGLAGYADLYVIKDRGSAMPWILGGEKGKRFVGRLHATPRPDRSERGVDFWVQPPGEVGQGPGGSLAQQLAAVDLSPTRAEINQAAKDLKLRISAADVVKALPDDPEKAFTQEQAMGQQVMIRRDDRKRVGYLATTAEVAEMTGGWVLADASEGTGQARRFYRRKAD